MKFSWSAAAVVIAAAIGAPDYADAFVAKTPTPPTTRPPAKAKETKKIETTPPPPSTTTTTNAETPPFYILSTPPLITADSSPEERIDALRLQLHDALRESERWRTECLDLRSQLSNNSKPTDIRILETIARAEEEKLRIRLEAVASIDELRADFDGYVEESQALICSLRGALEERNGRNGEEEVESSSPTAIAVVAEEEGAEEMSVVAVAETNELKEGLPAVAMAIETKEVITNSESSSPLAGKVVPSRSLTDSEGEMQMLGDSPAKDDETETASQASEPSTKAEVATKARGPQAAGGEAESAREESESTRLRKEEDLALTRRAIMDFVKAGISDGTSDDEDAFVLSTKDNGVDYIEKIEKRIDNRAARRMSLRERLAAMEEDEARQGTQRQGGKVASTMATAMVPAAAARVATRPRTTAGARRPAAATAARVAPRRRAVRAERPVVATRPTVNVGRNAVDQSTRRVVVGGGEGVATSSSPQPRRGTSLRELALRS